MQLQTLFGFELQLTAGGDTAIDAANTLTAAGHLDFAPVKSIEFGVVLDQRLRLQRVESAGGTDEPGILSTHIYSDGRHHDALYVDGGPSSTKSTGHLRMDGREVFRHAVVRMAEAIDTALSANGLTPGDIDWLVPHQANARIIDAMAKRLNLPADRVVLTVDRHANTSAASIPLALAEATTDGRIQRGDLVMLEAMGGGFTWGSALIRW